MSSISNVLITQAMISVYNFVLVGTSKFQLVLLIAILISNQYGRLFPPVLFFEILLINGSASHLIL